MPHSFTRQSEADRRQAFVRATISCLAEHGYHGTSVRKIAAAANVTPGLLTHYYAGKEQLIADAYRFGAEATRMHALDAANAAGPSPVARYKAFMDASLTGPDMAVDLFRVWLNFWSTTLTAPLVREAHQETYQAYRATLADLIADLMRSNGIEYDREDLARLATGLNALIDGLWLERGLDGKNFDSAEAAHIVHRFVGSAIGLSLD